ncbi:hypothetical protein RCOM_0723850 [Ricinus communis]|uniref:Uncharacterized protein n=1 Tax=Ricinus communis TaxID=3988 RepID=B9SFV8_RICCO|nr:hypothetical protein RCOM_0723850 [Ricinus communis]
MASTLLATTAITLSSLISVFVSSTSNSGNTASQLVYGNKSSIVSSVKYFTILLCFLVAFLCNVQSIRYYAHVSFLATLPTSMDKKECIEYVARNLNRGTFNSLFKVVCTHVLLQMHCCLHNTFVLLSYVLSHETIGCESKRYWKPFLKALGHFYWRVMIFELNDQKNPEICTVRVISFT